MKSLIKKSKDTKITDRELKKMIEEIGANKVLNQYMESKIFLNVNQLDFAISVKNKKEGEPRTHEKI